MKRFVVFLHYFLKVDQDLSTRGEVLGPKSKELPKVAAGGLYRHKRLTPKRLRGKKKSEVQDLPNFILR